jgi:type IV secretory pathway VirB2 component (pilin)
MVEAFSNLFTAFGLSSSAGLNAYLPLLVVALAARYTHLITLNEPWNVMTSGWVIGALVALLLIEMTVDKIPAVDTLNDTIQTVGRPVAGAVLFAASSGVVGDLHPIVAFIAGLLLAGTVHTVKTTARPFVTASTAGTGNWVVSILEDVLALIASIMAILLPIVIGLIIIFLLLSYFWWRNRRQTKPKTVTA